VAGIPDMASQHLAGNQDNLVVAVDSMDIDMVVAWSVEVRHH